MSKSNSRVNWPEIFVGFLLFLFGAGLDLTVAGLPPGITADIIGVVLMIHGAGAFRAIGA